MLSLAKHHEVLTTIDCVQGPIIGEENGETGFRFQLLWLGPVSLRFYEKGYFQNVSSHHLDNWGEGDTSLVTQLVFATFSPWPKM